MSKIIELQPLLLELAASSLKKDKGFVREAVKKNGLALQYADDSLKKDKEVVLEAVKDYGNALEFADASLKKDREVVLEAVKSNARSLSKENFDIRGSWLAVRNIGETLSNADPSLRKDCSFWHKCMDEVYAKTPFIPKEMQTEDKKTIKDLLELNINFPERFATKNIAKEIIKNRQNIGQSDSRPLAVLIYAKIDHNNAFASDGKIAQLIKEGYRVEYFEAENEKELYKNLKDATVNQKQKADVLIIGGHGTRESTALSEYNTYPEREERYLDLTDEKEMQDQKLGECLEKKGTIILGSCSTGEGRQDENNLANLMKKLFPEAHVFAPAEPTAILSLKFNRQHEVTDVILFCSDPYSAE